MQADLPISGCPVPAVHAAKKTRRRALRRNNVGNVAQAIGPIEQGCEIFAMTNGQFSAIDIIEHVLSFTGPAEIDLATWTAADGDLRRAHAFLLDGRVKGIRLVVDPSFRSRKPDFCNTLVELFGNDAIRTIPLHGKFITIRNDDWSIAIRTSMNLNLNKRIETVEISDDPELCGMLTGFVDEVFVRSEAQNFNRAHDRTMAKHDIASRLAF